MTVIGKYPSSIIFLNDEKICTFYAFGDPRNKGNKMPC